MKASWQNLKRLQVMAKAYVCSSTKYGFGQRMQGNPQLLADILAGQEWVNKYAFNDKCVNKAGAVWYANEISSPTCLAEIMLCIYPALSADQKARYVAAMHHMNASPFKNYIKSFHSTGMDRVNLANLHMLRAIIEKDEARMKLAIAALDEPLTIRSRAADELTEPTAGKKKTQAKRTESDANEVEESEDETGGGKAGKKKNDGFYADGTFIPHGSILYNGGYGITHTVATLIPAVPPADAANFKAMVKAWIQQDAFGNLFTFANYQLSLQKVVTLKGIAADPTIKPRSHPVQSHVHYAGDFVAHHRGKWAAALSMSSTRIATHECIWATNKRGWYQGDGMLMIYAGDPKKYNDDYGALVNPYRMPGTTVDTQPREDGIDSGGNSGKLSTSPWAGGVELGRRYSVASMELHAQEATLCARKSWFFFDNEIVCLGAGITSTDGCSIETIIENTKPPTTATFNRGERWAHLGGTGWYFPQPVDYRTNRYDRTGSWKDVWKKEAPVPITRNFFEIWIEHGKNPQDAGYAYVVLPGATAEQAHAYAGKPGIEILANTPKVQAVRAGNLLGINFWEAGEMAGVKSSASAAVLIEETADKLVVAVSDPTQLQTQNIELTIPRHGRAAVMMTIPVNGGEGRSFTEVYPK